MFEEISNEFKTEVPDAQMQAMELYTVIHLLHCSGARPDGCVTSNSSPHILTIFIGYCQRQNLEYHMTVFLQVMLQRTLSSTRSIQSGWQRHTPAKTIWSRLSGTTIRTGHRRSTTQCLPSSMTSCGAMRCSRLLPPPRLQQGISTVPSIP